MSRTNSGGFVSLVGSGPGDPDLLTMKAVRALSEADWVIYDYLANPEHLRHVRPECRSVCVGKGFRHKKISQRKINALILREAAKGHRVVRLKGGDPYLFGRGGEEALFLKRHKIPFEVVPGITSATAVANYAGIPLTHRDHNTSVTLLTGHRAANDSLDGIDWERIAKMPGTLVIYMGLVNLDLIAKKLMGFGLSGRTPTAVVEWGTLPRQRKAVSRLSLIASTVRRLRFKPPCLIIIGDVVALEKELDWYGSLPLSGRRIWLTRPKDRSGALAERLRRLGADVREFPLIRIEPPVSWKALDETIRSVGAYDVLVFTSASGVESFFGRLRQLGSDARALKGLLIAAVGPETCARLRQNGVRADIIPEVHRAKALVDAVKRTCGSLKDRQVLLVQGRIAPDDLSGSFRKHGADVRRVGAYDTMVDERGREDLRRSLKSGPPDAFVLASSSAAQNLLDAMGRGRWRRASAVRFISIGPMTTSTLKNAGVGAIEAKTHDLDGLVAAVLRAFPKKKGG